MYVCMYICMYVYMYVCIYICALEELSDGNEGAAEHIAAIDFRNPMSNPHVPLRGHIYIGMRTQV